MSGSGGPGDLPSVQPAQPRAAPGWTPPDAGPLAAAVPARGAEPGSAPHRPLPASPAAPGAERATAGSQAPAEAWQPRPYPQLLRGPRFRWWQCLASLGIGVGGVIGLLILSIPVFLVFYVVGTSGGDPPPSFDDTWGSSPPGLLLTNLVLAALIPVSMLAVWGGYGWRPRWLASVTGRIRWTWLGLCSLAALALTAGPTLLLAVLTEDVGSWKAEEQWPLLLAVVLTTTPLQAAGEEYLFRGWLPQLVGSAFPSALAGALVGGTGASLLFAFAHGQQDPWLFCGRLAFGGTAAWLVWRTGGLEASIALHVVNNMTAFGLTIAQGGLADSLTITEADPLIVLIDITTMVLVAAAIDLLARRRGIVRLFTPPRAVPSASPLPVLSWPRR
jgi:membrane protease YdiL (CAAX protease family)